MRSNSFSFFFSFRFFAFLLANVLEPVYLFSRKRKQLWRTCRTLHIAWNSQHTHTYTHILAFTQTHLICWAPSIPTSINSMSVHIILRLYCEYLISNNHKIPIYLYSEQHIESSGTHRILCTENTHTNAFDKNVYVGFHVCVYLYVCDCSMLHHNHNTRTYKRIQIHKYARSTIHGQNCSVADGR